MSKLTKETFLNLRTFPARLRSQEVAWMLGFEEHDIQKLVQKRFLKPLGNPPPNCVKVFWLKDVQELAEDRDKLAKASDAIRRRTTSENVVKGDFETAARTAA